MAEQADDGFLLYLIDMAIIEAHANARSSRDSAEAINPRDPGRNDHRITRATTPDLQIVN